MRRIQQYKKYFDEPALEFAPLVVKYKDYMEQATQTFTGGSCYVPGDTIEGDTLRSFSSEPIISGPIVCQLCDDISFLYDDDFQAHQRNLHCGVNEYRKRVLFLQEQCGPRAISGEEKRIMVQNFAHFQQFSRPGAKSNTFARISEVPRCEAACALCARKDFIEHRHMLNLFAPPPEDGQRVEFRSRSASQPARTEHEEEEPAEEANNKPHRLIKHEMVYYVQNPEAVNELLNVERYAARWPLIPVAELHASSVQHPSHPEWRWLLHSRRVPMQTIATEETSGAAQSADIRPRCAGIGDANCHVWSCWDCLMDIIAKKPKMPESACANDNWIGRERLIVREASIATKALVALGRCCWKQVRLGRHKDPAVQETGLTANSIFLAQPTADVPTLELPPPPDALVDSFNVVFTRSLDDLSKAEWARVSRQEYMQIVTERQLQCPAFSNVKVRHDLASTRLPVDGIPEHITACATQVSGSERAPMRLDGPASKAPDSGKVDDGGQTSSEDKEDTECEECNNAADDASFTAGAEASIAVDSVHEIKPVRQMQALRAQLQAFSNLYSRGQRLAASRIS
jgi:hypothetical protein